MPINPLPTLLICMLVIPLSISSQHKRYAKLDKKEIRGVYPFIVDEVIDARRSPTRNIGYFLNGNGILSPVYLKGELPESLMDFFSTSLHSSGETVLPLIIKINEIDLLEFSDEMGHFLAAKLNLTFISQYNGQYYKLLQTEHFVKDRTYAATLSKSTDKLVTAFALCFDELHHAYQEPDLYGDIVSKEWVYAPYVPQKRKLTCPIAWEPKRNGIYETFEDFLKNTPTQEQEITVKRKKRKADAWAGSYELTPMMANTRGKVQEGWGFCYEDTAYVYHMGSYFPISIGDSSLSFEGYSLPGFSSNPSVSVVSAYYGGLVGGLVGGMIAAGISGSATNQAYKKEKSAYHINPSTGEIIIEADNLLHKRKNKAKIVLFRRKKREASFPIPVSVNDSLLQPFYPYTTSELVFSLPHQPIEICLDQEKTNCKSIVLDPHNTVYLECSQLEDSFSYQAVLIETNEDTGKFWSHKAGFFEQKREKVR